MLVPKLLELGRRYAEHKLRLWLWRDRVYIAIGNGDQLAAGSLFSPLDIRAAYAKR